MVFVFGIDVPLVELIFVLTLILILLFALLIYVVIIQSKLNKRLKEVLRKENLELRGLESIEDKESHEINLLNRLLFGMLPGKKSSTTITKKTITEKTTKKPKKRKVKRKKPVKRRKPRKKPVKRRKPRKKPVKRVVKKTTVKKTTKKGRRVWKNGRWVYVP